MSRFILCLLVCCSILTIAPWASADEATNKAVEYVEKLGGKVVRVGEMPGETVVAVDLSGVKITDRDLKELAALKDLKLLDLSRTEVTDAGLK